MRRKCQKDEALLRIQKIMEIVVAKTQERNIAAEISELPTTSSATQTTPTCAKRQDFEDIP